MLVQINNTEKADWITIRTNVLFDAGLLPNKIRNIRKSLIGSIGLRNTYIVFYDSRDNVMFSCSNDLAQTAHLPIEEVNGVTLINIEDLHTKLLALL